MLGLRSDPEGEDDFPGFGGHLETADGACGGVLGAEEGEDQALPGLVGRLLPDTQHEPPAALVERVLPHGLDALLEEEKLGAVRELVGPHDMLIVVSEVLGSVKGTDLLYRLLELAFGLLRDCVRVLAEPVRKSIPERVLV